MTAFFVKILLARGQKPVVVEYWAHDRDGAYEHAVRDWGSKVIGVLK
jgi:hypothetical protein